MDALWSVLNSQMLVRVLQKEGVAVRITVQTLGCVLRVPDDEDDGDA